MTEQFKNGDFSAPRQTEPEVLVLIKKMQQQLIFLEKKLDILINQSQEKPFREKSFSKSFRSFDRPYSSGPYRGKRSQGEDSKERGFRSGHHSEKRPGDENRGFGGEKRGFGSKKKLSFHKRKD
jgi:hypothetical protein